MKPSQFETYFNRGQALSVLLRQKFCNQLDEKIALLQSEKVEKTTQQLVAEKRTLVSNFNYSLQTKYGKELDKFYRPDGVDVVFPPNSVGGQPVDYGELKPFLSSVLGYAGLVNWLCSEGYYTNYAVYAIVVCLQLGYHGNDFKSDVWLVASLENLADLIKHMLHALHDPVQSEMAIKKTYIKFSKYQYRIHFCLMKYYSSVGDTIRSNNHKTKFNRLKDAIDIRKSFDMEKAQSKNIFGPDCMDAQGFTVDDVKQWLANQSEIVVEVIQRHMFLPEDELAVGPSYSGAGKKRKKTRRKGRKKSKRHTRRK